MVDTLLHWHDGLAPGQFRSGNGELTVGAVGLAELAETYGTPLLVIDRTVFDASIDEFVRACAPHGVEIAYAGKALLLIAIARHLARTPLHVDVCSIGELVTAERGGVPVDRLTLHGCGKNGAELDAVIAGRLGTIVVDNLDELRSLLARSAPERAVRLLLRVNTGVEAHTHDFVRTAGDKSKFGMSGDELAACAQLLHDHPQARLQFAGLHAHIGSQIHEAAAFTANAAALMAQAASFAARGLPCECLVVGGGFGVAVHPDDSSAIDVAATIAAIAREVRDAADRETIAPPRIGIEPGRALVARAGTSLYRVMAAKRQFGTPYVIVDGGMADNPRPAIYGAYHHPLLASRDERAVQETVLCGRSCENDQMAVAPLPVQTRAGDLLAVCTTGAYTYSMASNYNRFPRPAVVLAGDGHHHLIARRESVDDVLRSDCDA